MKTWVKVMIFLTAFVSAISRADILEAPTCNNHVWAAPKGWRLVSIAMACTSNDDITYRNQVTMMSEAYPGDSRKYQITAFFKTNFFPVIIQTTAFAPQLDDKGQVIGKWKGDPSTKQLKCPDMWPAQTEISQCPIISQAAV